MRPQARRQGRQEEGRRFVPRTLRPSLAPCPASCAACRMQSLTASAAAFNTDGTVAARRVTAQADGWTCGSLGDVRPGELGEGAVGASPGADVGPSRVEGGMSPVVVQMWLCVCVCVCVCVRACVCARVRARVCNLHIVHRPGWFRRVAG